jgi:hypothetical protein
MSRIADESVRAARAKLEALSADEETRRLAFVRERALSDKRTLLREAREDGRAEGKAEALGETAVNMIRNTSLDDPTIAAITGLPVATVASLRRHATG